MWRGWFYAAGKDQVGFGLLASAERVVSLGSQSRGALTPRMRVGSVGIEMSGSAGDGCPGEDR